MYKLSQAGVWLRCYMVFNHSTVHHKAILVLLIDQEGNIPTSNEIESKRTGRFNIFEEKGNMRNIVYLKFLSLLKENTSTGNITLVKLIVLHTTFVHTIHQE